MREETGPVTGPDMVRVMAEDELESRIRKDLAALRGKGLGCNDTSFEWLVKEIAGDVRRGDYEWEEKKGKKKCE